MVALLSLLRIKVYLVHKGIRLNDINEILMPVLSKVGGSLVWIAVAGAPSRNNRGDRERERDGTP